MGVLITGEVLGEISLNTRAKDEKYHHQAIILKGENDYEQSIEVYSDDTLKTLGLSVGDKIGLPVYVNCVPFNKKAFPTYKINKKLDILPL